MSSLDPRGVQMRSFAGMGGSWTPMPAAAGPAGLLLDRFLLERRPSRLSLPRVPLNRARAPLASRMASSAKQVAPRETAPHGRPAWYEAASSLAFMGLCWISLEAAIYATTGNWWGW
jgi:hypothetical protein